MFSLALQVSVEVWGRHPELVSHLVAIIDDAVEVGEENCIEPAKYRIEVKYEQAKISTDSTQKRQLNDDLFTSVRGF